jgi:hypothetical protein
MSHHLMHEDNLRPVPASTVAAIELQALSKTFGEIRAIDRLTLTVRQGEIYGLLGPNATDLARPPPSTWSAGCPLRPAGR